MQRARNSTSEAVLKKNSKAGGDIIYTIKAYYNVMVIVWCGHNHIQVG